MQGNPNYCRYDCMIAHADTNCTCKTCYGRLHGVLYGWMAKPQPKLNKVKLVRVA